MAGTVFVTGGSGYVGRTLVKALLASGYDVHALARNDRAIAIVRKLGARAVGGDLFDREALRGGLKGCTGLIHAAADTDLRGASARQARVNVEGTRLVMTLAREAGVQRAVHISTEAVLADGKPIVDADESWPMPSHFVGHYARTKAIAEQLALGESRGGGEQRFSVCAIRPRLVWGRDDTSLLPKLVAAAKSGRLRWIDGGRYLTSTTHVANLAVGAMAALERGAAGQAYFITDGPPQQFRRFASALLETQGVAPPTREASRWTVRASMKFGAALQRMTAGLIKPGMSAQEFATLGQEVTVSDDRARHDLGYRPQVSFTQGLAELREIHQARLARAAEPRKRRR